MTITSTFTSPAYEIQGNGPSPLIDADYLVIEVDGVDASSPPEPAPVPVAPPRDRIRDLIASHRLLLIGAGSIVALGLGVLVLRARRG